MISLTKRAHYSKKKERGEAPGVVRVHDIIFCVNTLLKKSHPMVAPAQLWPHALRICPLGAVQVDAGEPRGILNGTRPSAWR